MSIQRDEDYWGPSPALAERISAAMEPEEVEWIAEEVACATNLDEEGLDFDNREALDRLTQLEEFFLSVLETILPKLVGFLPRDVLHIMAVEASDGLVDTACCRSLIRAGGAGGATWHMYQATKSWAYISAEMDKEISTNDLERDRGWVAAREVGLKTISENRRQERDKRRGDYRKWCAQGITKEQIPREARVSGGSN
jgi:hypothetical protein